MLKKSVNYLKKQFLDTIFPIRCLGCNNEGNYLCNTCLNTIKLNIDYCCPRCNDKNNDSSYCQECEVTSKMNGLLVTASYENELLQKTILLLKYKLVRDAGEPLSKLLVQYLNNWINIRSIDPNKIIIIPVPLHKKKYKFRGFNQTEILARHLAEKGDIKYDPNILFRNRHTTSQAKLNPLKRRKNIKNAFKITPTAVKKAYSDNIFIILDDVCTTSSTLEECAKTLDKLNPAQIWGLVLAKGK